MAKSDVLVRMKADTKDYDANIAKARKQLDQFKNDNFSAGGALKQMSSNLVATAAKFASFGAAAGAAMKVAKDAFFKNEQQLDEWGRTVESSKSIYSSFLDSLNTGDISGFLSSIDQIVKAARDAYDAIDELNTFNAFNQRNVARARRGFTESMVAYREGTGSKESVQAASAAYKKELAERQKLEEEAYRKRVAELAKQRGVSYDDLMAAMSGTYGSYKELKAMPETGKRTVYNPGLMPGQAGSYSTQTFPANNIERLGAALRRLNDDELQALQAMGAKAEDTADQMAQIDKQAQRVLRGRPGGGGGSGTASVKGGVPDFNVAAGQGINTTESMNSLKQLLSYWQAELANATNSAAAGQAEAMIANVQRLIDSQPLALRLGVSAEQAATWKESIDRTIASWKFEPIEINVKSNGIQKDVEAINTMAKTSGMAATAVGNLGAALQNLDDPSAKVAGIVMQAIANVALGFAQAAASPATGALGVFGWIAAATAGVATMAATIAQIHSVTGYAEGGVVEGNSTAGDRLFARVNSGETILTRLQAERVNDALDAAPIASGGVFEMVTQGEAMVSTIRNYGKRRGLRGERIFTEG